MMKRAPKSYMNLTVKPARKSVLNPPSLMEDPFKLYRPEAKTSRLSEVIRVLQIMRKCTTTANIMAIERNNKIPEEPYSRTIFWTEPSASWLPARRAYSSQRAYRAKLTVMIRNLWDAMRRQTCSVKCEAYFTGMAYDLFRGSKLMVET